MGGIETLIRMVEQRLNLNCYTAPEFKMLTNFVATFRRTGKLSPKQEAKLREIVRVRYIMGEEPHIDPTGKPTGKPFPKERLDKDQPIIRYINIKCKNCSFEVNRIIIRMNSTKSFERECYHCGSVTTFELDEQRTRVVSATFKPKQGEMYGAG